MVVSVDDQTLPDSNFAHRARRWHDLAGRLQAWYPWGCLTTTARYYPIAGHLETVFHFGCL